MKKSNPIGQSLDLHAKSLANMEGWEAYAFEVKDSPYGKYFEVKGAVCSLYIRGDRKGKINYSNQNKATRCKFDITPEAHAIFIDRWEKENDKCIRCEGKLKIVLGWSATEGDRYATCNRCNGTGKPNLIQEEVDGFTANQ